MVGPCLATKNKKENARERVRRHIYQKNDTSFSNTPLRPSAHFNETALIVIVSTLSVRRWPSPAAATDK